MSPLVVVRLVFVGKEVERECTQHAIACRDTDIVPAPPPSSSAHHGTRHDKVSHAEEATKASPIFHPIFAVVRYAYELLDADPELSVSNLTWLASE